MGVDFRVMFSDSGDYVKQGPVAPHRHRIDAGACQPLMPNQYLLQIGLKTKCDVG